ncbi:SPOR domain-containing protein [Marimonas arenosa]|uniref:SPOR domain-containing protein n=1 Tax=Marimonas arenosa TaxID=1795305 RepID=A0AAE3WCR2_9RHOB|nr:SPOR domain-containing protein [Marimonas arenosa]MDQ2090098.1 SPOR domain-containing protein [Marimonas arenosa]
MGFVGSNRITLERVGRGVLAFGLVASLAACEDGVNFDLFQTKPDAESEQGEASSARSGKTTERDVEAPEVFQVTEAGLWDGRPSLGGVWVAHPDVKDPERVLIRNEANNKFVVGALFRRERENPGPRLQVSSDAAEALGMLAGQPMKLNVTALRREEVVEEPPQDEVMTETALDVPSEVAATPLDPIAGAAAAIESAEGAVKPVEAAAAPAPKPKPKPKKSGLEKPYIQIGIFSVEKNANNTATAMRQAGMIPTVKKQSIKDKPFWRVLVGPANTSAERAELLKKIKASGFTDAYFVTN